MVISKSPSTCLNATSHLNVFVTGAGAWVNFGPLHVCDFATPPIPAEIFAEIVTSA
jgi:hypothetical protein